MTISERLEQDIKEAMRARQADRLSVLRMLKSALMNAAIEAGGGPQGKLGDTEATAVIRKQVKQRQDSVESFRQAGREEQAAREATEIELLNAYLPQALDAAALDALIDEAIRETGATTKAQMGAVMKALQPKVAGRADGKTLSQAVQSPAGRRLARG